MKGKHLFDLWEKLLYIVGEKGCTVHTGSYVFEKSSWCDREYSVQLVSERKIRWCENLNVRVRYDVRYKTYLWPGSSLSSKFEGPRSVKNVVITQIFKNMTITIKDYVVIKCNVSLPMLLEKLLRLLRPFVRMVCGKFELLAKKSKNSVSGQNRWTSRILCLM